MVAIKVLLKYNFPSDQEVESTCRLPECIWLGGGSVCEIFHPEGDLFVHVLGSACIF